MWPWSLIAYFSMGLVNSSLDLSSEQPGSKVIQLALFEVPVQEKAVGAEAASPFIRLVVSPQPEDEDS
jgi:hypothetical protein